MKILWNEDLSAATITRGIFRKEVATVTRVCPMNYVYIPSGRPVEYPYYGELERDREQIVYGPLLDWKEVE